ncbi:MAG: hypothetical protein HQL89_17110 [Magnetococcales bacterium]|nr:hypothetical protein [Magnetococcales bacterium]
MSDTLPDSLKEMIPEIGMEGVKRLVQTCGGMAFKHLPPRPTSDHLLVRLVGMDLAHTICRIHAHCDLYVPRALKAINANRDALIVARFDAGASVHELVQEFKLTERWIRQILNRPTADPRQLVLDFDPPTS